MACILDRLSMVLILVSAATKYIVGHSDVMSEVRVANKKYWPTFEKIHTYLVNVLADDAYLALRGLRTMAVRLKQHEQAAIEAAKWLETHPLVDHIRHPPLQRPGHEFFKRDFDGSNGLFSFVMKQGNHQAIDAQPLDSLHHFKMGLGRL